MIRTFNHKGDQNAKRTIIAKKETVDETKAIAFAPPNQTSN